MSNIHFWHIFSASAKDLNLYHKSYLFLEAFNTSLELQTSCLWIKLNLKKSCNARHDAKKQWFTERYKLILENWAVVTSKNLRKLALQTQPQNKNSFVLSIHTSFQNKILFFVWRIWNLMPITENVINISFLKKCNFFALKRVGCF